MLASGLLVLSACSEGPKPAVPFDAGNALERQAGVLESLAGDVTLERNGVRTKAAVGPLRLGDALETGADGELVVKLAQGRLIEVGPDARFVLGEDEKGLLLDVSRGVVLSRVPREASTSDAPGVALTILTPFGLTRVGQSEVELAVGPESTRVDVKVGTIEMVSRNGQAISVSPGEAMILSRGGAEPLRMPAVPIVIASVAGKAELKKKDQAQWLAVKGKTPLEAGDGVRVRDGRATLESNGVRLSAPKGTELEVGESTDGTTGLSLRKGGLSAVLPPKKKSVLELGDLTLVSDEGGQLALEKTTKGYALEALAGDVRVERQGQAAVTVPGGKAAKLSSDAVEVNDVAPDALSLPTRPGLKVFHPGLSRVALDWPGTDGKPYRVEVATEPSFTNLVLAGTVHQTYVNVPLPSKGNLHWRVFDGEQEIDRGSAFFAPEPQAGGNLDRNRNEVKDGAEKTTIYFQDKPPSVTLQWKAEEGATKFKVQVYREGELRKAVAEREVKELQVALPEGSLGEGKFLWSVTPLDAKGKELRGGKMNKLELSYDNAVPSLIIKAPKNGDPAGARVRTSGIAPVGTKVSCNGRLLDLDEKGRFDDTVVPLPGGKLVYRMVKAGAEVYTVRRLR